jgi:hypothetical protein
MLMDEGGKTFVIIGAMSRSHALQLVKQQYPKWHPTGEIEEMN